MFLIRPNSLTLLASGSLPPTPDTEYLEDGMNEYKFKAKLSEDFIDRQVVLDCPKLIDATSREQVELYLKDFEDAMSGSNSDDFIETNVSSDDLDELVDEIDEDELDDSEENA